jgi:glycerol-3-phosphate acyltransferase PlsY
MIVLVILLAYMVGALPMGYLLLCLIKGQDITQIGSGRTGGTNAMRAGGPWIGLLTSVLDLAKGYSGVLIARWLMPASIWASVLAGAVTVLGHNWSIWLYLRTKKVSAGAGTGPNIGAAMAFWPWIGAIAIPDVLFFVLVIGYASLASLSTALVVVLAFAIRAAFFGQPWEYIVFGVMTTFMVVWALRPNIQRLLNGTERRGGIFGKKRTEDHSSSSNSSSSSS